MSELIRNTCTQEVSDKPLFWSSGYATVAITCLSWADLHSKTHDSYNLAYIASATLY